MMCSMEHLVPRLKVGSVVLTIVGIQVAIWIVFLPISFWLALISNLVFATLATKFFTTGPNINFITPWWVRNDELFFINCVMAGVNPGIIRRFYRFLPSDPRCRFCLVPFGGVGKALRIKPSAKNPNFCRSCIEYAPIGVYEMEVGVIFADIRNFTAWSEKHSPSEASDRLFAFRRIANRVFTKDDVFIEFIGGGVMVLFFPRFPSLGEDTPKRMIEAGLRLHKAVSDEFATDDLSVGIGINQGLASVGNVGDSFAKDFTAVGDVVNTGSRLQNCAKAGQIVVAADVFNHANGAFPEAKPASFTVKGKQEPVSTFVLEAKAQASRVLRM